MLHTHDVISCSYYRAYITAGETKVAQGLARGGVEANPESSGSVCALLQGSDPDLYSVIV